MPLYRVAIEYRVHGKKFRTATTKVHAKSKTEAAHKIQKINNQWQRAKRIKKAGLTATVTKVTPIRQTKRKRIRKRTVWSLF